jgi:hypothetical protein
LSRQERRLLPLLRFVPVHARFAQLPRSQPILAQSDREWIIAKRLIRHLGWVG